jgi:hypothetical protein
MCSLHDLHPAGLWLTAADPGFANVTGMNFTIVNDSKVKLQIPGWEPIDFDAIGLESNKVGPT